MSRRTIVSFEEEDYETPTDFLEKKRPEILRDEALASMEINSIIEHAKQCGIG